MDKGRIIFLNGVTSSDKTSIVEKKLMKGSMLWRFKKSITI